MTPYRKLLGMAMISLTLSDTALAKAVTTGTTATPLTRLYELQSPIAHATTFYQVGEQNITASLNKEAGTTTMLAARNQTDNSKVYVFEIYKDDTAYQTHIQSPHFKQYLTQAAPLLTGKQFIETIPQVLLDKPQRLNLSDYSQNPANHAQLRLATLTVKPESNADFAKIVSTEMQLAMQKETGVLAMYAVTEKAVPNKWHFFEVYANESAYQAHRQTPHFKDYIAQTGGMVTDKQLGVLDIILLQTQGNLSFTANHSHNTTLGAQHMTLSQKEQALVQISSLVATADMAKLKTALAQALDSGVTINEIKDEMVQLYAYCGFPRSLNALNALNELLTERKQAGIQDTEGKTATPLPKDTDILALGTKTQTELVGKPVNVAVSPDIDRYLKTHLFGDIFASDVLSYQERELITVATLASLSGVESQLQSHLAMSKHIGISEDKLQAVLALVKQTLTK